MEIKIPIIDIEDETGRYFANIKLSVADEYVFFDGIERVPALRKKDELDDSTFNSIIADPEDVTLVLPTKQLYILAKMIVAFYEMGGVREYDK